MRVFKPQSLAYEPNGQPFLLNTETLGFDDLQDFARQHLRLLFAFALFLAFQKFADGFPELLFRELCRRRRRQ